MLYVCATAYAVQFFALLFVLLYCCPINNYLKVCYEQACAANPNRPEILATYTDSKGLTLVMNETIQYNTVWNVKRKTNHGAALMVLATISRLHLVTLQDSEYARQKIRDTLVQ